MYLVRTRINRSLLLFCLRRLRICLSAFIQPSRRRQKSNNNSKIVDRLPTTSSRNGRAPSTSGCARGSHAESLSVGPWIVRNSPRQSTFDTTSPVSPKFSIPEEDNVPLSQRRTMLQHRQQQKAQPRVTSPSAPPPHRTRSGASGQGQAIMAAWRHSVRKDLREKRDPLGWAALILPGIPMRQSSPPL